MDDGIGVGITGIDAERLRQPRAIGGLDRGEAKAPRRRRASATKRIQREQNTQTPS